MKIKGMRSIIVAAIATALLVMGSTVASAQSSCPTSPNYSPDFSSVPNQACLTLNNNGADPGYPAFVTAVSGTSTALRLTPNQLYTAGSAWYNTQQLVSSAFSTTFTFQLSGTTPNGVGNADGIAFLIQNSASAGTSALGPNGCGIGFGDDTLIGCTSSTGGITNSLAVEINSYQNSGIDPSSSDVTIQNCTPAGSPTGPNSVDPTCTIAVIDLTQLANPINVADGNVHTVTISYSGPTSTLLDVILDGNDLFAPSLTGNTYDGVLFNLASIGLASGSSCSNCLAWVGFTAATGGGDDNQDILSWTFTPTAQTAVVTTTGTTTLNFPNASGNNVYAYTAELTSVPQNPTPSPTPVTVQPILMTQQACDALVQVNFWPARCFVYENAENSGTNASVLFSVTCPDSPGGTCGSSSDEDFFAELGTVFEFSYAQNPFFVYPGIIGLLNPFPGWLKGSGPNPLAPCTPPSSGPLFQSNQVDQFFIDNGTTKGKASGTGSCWVATYDTPGEIWPGITISLPAPQNYNLNQQVTASYTCSNPATSQPSTSATGPYLTAASCTQATGTQNSCSFTPPPGGGLSCTGTVPTSTKGLHLFTVTAIDSGGNQNVDAVAYNVK